MKILFVDDEVRITAGLKRMLWRYRTEWDMHFASSGQEALELLDEGGFDLIISDVRMPGLSGIDMLLKARTQHPELTRIILSGQVEQVDSMRCTEVAHQYLAKPCDAATLRETILRSKALRKELDNPGLVAAISGMQSLPAAPKLYQQLTRELISDEPSIGRVGSIVSADVAMTAKILQLVNSAFFSLRSTVSSIGDAVSLLGTETIRALVLSTELCHSSSASGPLVMAYDQIWSRSLRVANLAKAIAVAEGNSPASAAEAFLAGILHDCGKLVFASNWPKKFLEFANDEDDLDREVLEFGADHASVGAYLLSTWGLPDEIVGAVAYHHYPSQSETRGFSTTAAVHAAHAIDSCQNERDKPDFDTEFLSEAQLDDHIELWLEVANKITYQQDEVHT